MRRRLGLVFQEPSIDGLLDRRARTCEFAAGLMGLGGIAARKAVTRRIERTGLTSQAARAARQLSGGWRRLTDIARATLHRPDLLILDEPTVGLDPEHRDRMWSLLDARASGAWRHRPVLDALPRRGRSRAIGVSCWRTGDVVAADTPAALRSRIGDQVVEIEGPDAEQRRARSAAVRDRAHDTSDRAWLSRRHRRRTRTLLPIVWRGAAADAPGRAARVARGCVLRSDTGSGSGHRGPAGPADLSAVARSAEVEAAPPRRRRRRHEHARDCSRDRHARSVACLPSEEPPCRRAGAAVHVAAARRHRLQRDRARRRARRRIRRSSFPGSS